MFLRQIRMSRPKAEAHLLAAADTLSLLDFKLAVVVQPRPATSVAYQNDIFQHRLGSQARPPLVVSLNFYRLCSGFIHRRLLRSDLRNLLESVSVFPGVGEPVTLDDLVTLVDGAAF